MSHDAKPALGRNRAAQHYPETGLTFSSFRIRPPAPEVAAESMAPIDEPKRSNRFRKRLFEAHSDIDELLLPIRKHWPDKSWPDNSCMYWLPATFENRAHTGADSRFMKLFEALIQFVTKKSEVRHFTFFDQQLTYPHLIEHFLLNAIEYLPVGALGFCPGKGLVAMPKHDQIISMDFRAVYEKLKEKKEAFQMSDVFPSIPRMLHFILGDQDMARRSLTGRGGYTFFLSQHGQNKFADIAKEILSRNTKDPLIEMIPMAAPLFDSKSFLNADAENRALYLSLFDLYVAEVPLDRGILIASTHDLDEKLIELVETCGYRKRRRSEDEGDYRVTS